MRRLRLQELAPAESAVALARELVLLGAESAIAIPADSIVDARAGFPGLDGKWAALAARLAACSDPLLTRLRAELGLSAHAAWRVALCTAAERHPDAAAALSILAEDERVLLPTPATFAGLAVASLDSDYDAALAEAMPGAPAERMGLIERADSLPCKPWSQQP